MTDDARPSLPSPPPAPPAERLGTGRYAAVGEADAARVLQDDVARALRIALWCRAQIGSAPDPSASPPDPGTGMRRSLAEILGKLSKVETLIEADIAARAKRGEWTTWAVRAALATLIALLVAATWHLAGRVRLVQGANVPQEIAGYREREP